MSQTTDTLRVPSAKPLKRCAIVGTAPTYIQTPWTDPTLEIFGLNDGYSLGMARADRWFDLHKFSQMAFVPPGARKIPQGSVPLGSYVRPAGHLDWLRGRPFPVMLQEAPLPGWKTAQQFPLAEVLTFWAKFWPWRVTASGVVSPGTDYEASTPALMLMWAVLQGYTEIHIYGIHLATEWEYISQRPNMELLIGVAAGLGIKIVLPTKTPLCKASYRYAYEPKGDLPIQAAQQAIDTVKAHGLRLQKKHAALPWWARGQREDLVAQLRLLDAQLLDAKMQQQKAKLRSVM